MNRIIFIKTLKITNMRKLYIYIYILFLLNITEKILLKNSVYINLIYN